MIDRKAHAAELLAFDHPYRQGGMIVAGMDEVGRGPLAGTVVTACVVMPEEPVPQGCNAGSNAGYKREGVLFLFKNY